VSRCLGGESTSRPYGRLHSHARVCVFWRLSRGPRRGHFASGLGLGVNPAIPMPLGSINHIATTTGPRPSHGGYPPPALHHAANHSPTNNSAYPRALKRRGRRRRTPPTTNITHGRLRASAQSATCSPLQDNAIQIGVWHTKEGSLRIAYHAQWSCNSIIIG